MTFHSPSAQSSVVQIQLMEEISQIEALRRDLWVRRLGREGATQLRVLNHLAGQDRGATPLEVSERLGIQPSTLSRTLSVMARAGWVVFAAHPTDRRCKCLWLTEAGDSTRDELFAELLPDLQKLSKMLRAYTQEETLYRVEQFRKVLRTYVTSTKLPKRRRPTPI